VLVHVEDMRVKVDGRLYENPHIIIVGVSHLAGEIAPRAVRIDARFDGYPRIDQLDEVLRVSMGGDFMADLTGSGVSTALETEEGYIIEGSRITIRFEVDEQSEKVIVKIPRVGTLKAEKLTISINKEASLNLISSPFVLGALTLAGPVRLTVTISGDSVGISTSEGGETRRKEIQSAAAERASS